MKALMSAVAAMCATASLANVVITDETPKDKAVAVPAGTELEIRGNGLSEDCTLTLGAGATVKFYRDATIAASVTSEGNVIWTTDSSAVIGTVSGVYTAKADGGADICVDAPGLVSFIGGGTIENGGVAAGATTKSRFCVRGNVQVTNKTFDVRCADVFQKGRFLVANGGFWKHGEGGGGQTGALLQMNQSQTGDCVFEIGKGGTVTYGNNEHVLIGNSTTYESKLYINGGTFETRTSDRIFLNDNGYGKSVIEIDNGGLLDTRRRILAYNRSGSSKVILRNGSWRGYKRGNDYEGLFATEGSVTGRKVDVEVDGTFSLDFSEFSNNRTNYADTADLNRVRPSWTGKPGSKLVVIGHSSKKAIFTFRGEISGLNLAGHSANYPIRMYVETDPAKTTVEPMSLGLYFPVPDGCTLTATSTNGVPTPALRLSYLSVNHNSLLKTGVWDGYGAVSGFSSYSAGDVLSLAPGVNGTIYASTRILKAFGKVEVLSGRLVAATKARDDIDVRSGASVVYQDSDEAISLENFMIQAKDGPRPHLFETETRSWSNVVAGVATTWIPGANAKVTTYRTDGGITGRIFANSLTFSMSGDYYWDYLDGGFDIGEGGVTFLDSHALMLCSKFDCKRVRLTENQTWTNAAASGVAILTSMAMDTQYWKPTFVATPNVTDWRLGPRTEVWLGSPDNDFSSTAITVERGSTIRLLKALDARLHARKVVLDGADMSFGGSTPVLRSRRDSVNTWIDAAHVAPEVELRNGGSLTAAGAATYDLPSLTATGAGNRLAGDGSLAIAETAGTITLPTASDALEIGVSLAMRGGRPLVVNGAGALTVDVSALDERFDIDLADGASLTFAGAGDFAGDVRNARAITVATDGFLNLTGSIVGFRGATISVTGGTLVLPNKAAIPSGVKVDTSNEGGLMLIDPSGFDPAADMTGTRNLVTPSALVVTDEPRENEHLFVGGGQTLEVYGSGLKESSSVTLGDGAKVMFHATATIFASLLSTGTVTFATAPTANGTVAGFYTAAPTGLTATVSFDAPGLLSFIGGGSILNGGVETAGAYPKQSVRLVRGNVQVTNRAFSVFASFDVYAGHFTVKDGGEWWQGYPQQDWAHLNLNVAQTDDVCVEVGQGGIFRIGNNNYLNLGGSTTYESKLYVNGGLFRRDQADHIFAAGKAVLEIDNGGIFASCREIECNDSNLRGRLILRDGTWNGNHYFSSCGASSLVGGKSGTFDVTLAGDFTLDQRVFTVANLANTVAGRSTWKALPGARLNLLGKEGASKTFTMRAFEGDGLAIAFNGNPNTTFVIEDATNETVRLGYVLPGQAGCSIRATGTSPALDVSYVVSEGGELDAGVFLAGNLPGTFGGFASVGWSGLAFDEGATLKFPFFGGEPTVLTVPGSVTLPAAMNFRVASKGAHTTVSGAPVLVAQEGLAGDAACVFTCAGGVSRKGASLAAEGDRLLFSYEMPGLVLLVR